MRVKVLVVAAMVITSVNASGKGKFGGWFGRSSMSKAESRHNLLRSTLSLSQEPEPTKKKPGGGSGGDDKDPFCDPIISKLYELHDEAVALSSNIPRQRQVSRELRGHRCKDADRDEYGYIEVDKLATRSELDDEDSPEMKQTKESLIALEKEYRKLWIPFINDCWAKSAYVLPPEKMIEKWFFFSTDKGDYA
ncbi:hypothetical protein BASA83_011216 [Batrachochytrium salamandrivorans]|nr:hypothetical protein BASA83_011216 [Batrachochytrium salamandrivorans]